jgi:hypothetical protein
MVLKLFLSHHQSMNKTGFIIFALGCFLSSVSLAQSFVDIANVSFYKSRPTNLFSNDNQSFYSKSFSVNVNLPIKIDSNNLISFNPVVDRHNYQLKTSTYSTRYLGLTAPLFFVHHWKNANWKTSVGFIFRNNSIDEPSPNKNSFQYGGVLLNTFGKKENLKFKFGVYANTEFFGLYVMPLLGIDWRVNKKLNVFGVLPSSMTVEYKINRRVSSGLVFKGGTASYRIEDEFFFRLDDNYLKVFVDVYLTHRIVLFAEYGHSVLRKIRSGKRINGETVYLTNNEANGYQLRFGFAYRIRLDNDNEVLK